MLVFSQAIGPTDNGAHCDLARDVGCPKGRRSAPSRCAGAAPRGGAVSPARGTARGALGPGSGARYPCFSLSSGGVVEGPCSGGVRVESRGLRSARCVGSACVKPAHAFYSSTFSRARLLPLSPLSSSRLSLLTCPLAIRSTSTTRRSCGIAHGHGR